MITKKLLNWLFDKRISNITGNEIGLLKVGIISLLCSVGDLYLLGKIGGILKNLTEGFKYTILTICIGFLVIFLIFFLGISIFGLKKFFDISKN